MGEEGPTSNAKWEERRALLNGKMLSFWLVS
jgi:hypothetical protein